MLVMHDSGELSDDSEASWLQCTEEVWGISLVNKGGATSCCRHAWVWPKVSPTRLTSVLTCNICHVNVLRTCEPVLAEGLLS